MTRIIQMNWRQKEGWIDRQREREREREREGWSKRDRERERQREREREGWKLCLKNIQIRLFTGNQILW